MPRFYDVRLPGDVPAGDVNLQQLNAAIILDPALIGVTFDYSGRKADQVDIWFTSALNPAQTVAIDAILFNHVPLVTTPAFQFWESNPDQSTSAETYQSAMSRTADPMAQGIYILTYALEMRVVPTGPLNSAGQCRFGIDGNIKGVHTQFHEEWQIISGWDRYVAVEGSEPVLLWEFRRNPNEGGNDSIEVRKLKLGLELKV
jgi:hypothetical protein